MNKFLLLIASFSLVYSQTTTCVGKSSTDCPNSGYCFWTGSACQMAECHKVTDVRACRSTTGWLYSQSKCQEISNNDPNFQNQCMEFDQTTLMYAYVRFPQDITQLSTTQTTSGYLVTTIMNAKYTTQYKYEILTVNILKASSTTELYNIMNAYVQMQYDLADPEIHPQYIEKAIYESMQAIRDDVTITATSTPYKRSDFHTVLWRMTDGYFLKLRSYQPYYISNKYLINFGFTHFNRNSITVTSQYQSTKVSWSSYAENGYLELLVVPAEQFGILSSSSDIIIIRPTKLDGSDGTLAYTIIWSWSYTGGTIPATLYSFDKISMGSFSSITSSTCNTSTKTCTFNISSIMGTKAYIIGPSSFSQQNTGRYYTRCRLRDYTWTGSTCNI